MRIGLFIRVLNDNYCLGISRLISQEVSLRNAQLVLFEGQSFDNSTPETVVHHTLFKLISHEHLDGLIFLSNSIFFQQNKDVGKSFADKTTIPIVSINLPFEGVNSVFIDNRTGFEKMVTHLISHGYRKFSLIGGPLAHFDALLRHDTFLDMMQKHGLNVPDSFVLEGTFGYLTGYNRALKLVPHIKDGSVDAVVCANDEMAFAAINCFTDNNIRVPEDVAVTGFDDTGLAAHCSPPITTVSQRLDLISKKAVAALFELIYGRKNVQEHTIEPELVIRQSCGCTGRCEKYPGVFIPYVSPYRPNLQTKLPDIEGVYKKLTDYLKDNGINHCYIVRYTEALPFCGSPGRKSEGKCSVFYGCSNGNRVSYQKTFSVTDLLPHHILDSIKEPMLIKPLYFGSVQFGYLLISAFNTIPSAIDDLGIELCLLLESLNSEEERLAADKKLSEIHDSLMISNKRLNELAVKENLDKLNNMRYLAANMLNKRNGNTTEYGLIIVEIDNYNDISRFGFNEGEFVISSVSDILAASIRDDDFLSHQSCERYVILLKNIQNDPIKTIGERFMQRLNRLNGSLNKPYTISLIWGSYLANTDSDFHSVYKHAEQNLLEFKQNKYIAGKNPKLDDIK